MPAVGKNQPSHACHWAPTVCQARNPTRVLPQGALSVIWSHFWCHRSGRRGEIFLRACEQRLGVLSVLQRTGCPTNKVSPALNAPGGWKTCSLTSWKGREIPVFAVRGTETLSPLLGEHGAEPAAQGATGVPPASRDIGSLPKQGPDTEPQVPAFPPRLPPSLAACG